MLQHSTKLYTASQTLTLNKKNITILFTTLYKRFLQHFTQLHKTLPNKSKTQLNKLYHNVQVLTTYTKTIQNLHNCTTLYTTIQQSITVYRPFPNSTRLYTSAQTTNKTQTWQHFTKLYNSIQNLYETARNITNQKLSHNCCEQQKTWQTIFLQHLTNFTKYLQHFI